MILHWLTTKTKWSSVVISHHRPPDSIWIIFNHEILNHFCVSLSHSSASLLYFCSIFFFVFHLSVHVTSVTSTSHHRHCVRSQSHWLLGGKWLWCPFPLCSLNIFHWHWRVTEWTHGPKVASQLSDDFGRHTIFSTTSPGESSRLRTGRPEGGSRAYQHRERDFENIAPSHAWFHSSLRLFWLCFMHGGGHSVGGKSDGVEVADELSVGWMRFEFRWHWIRLRPFKKSKHLSLINP